MGAGARLLFWDAGSGGQSGDKDIPLVASQPRQGGDLGDFQPGLVMLSRVGFELVMCQHLTHSGSRKNEAGHRDLCHWVSVRGVPGSAREEVWGRGGMPYGNPPASRPHGAKHPVQGEALRGAPRGCPWWGAGGRFWGLQPLFGGVMHEQRWLHCHGNPDPILG